jgi:hypothetical protein
MMYYSKITVQKTPKTIQWEVKHDLGYDVPEFTFSELRTNYGVTEEDSFYTEKHENSNEITLHVCKKRLETEQELAERITKEEAYNANYEEFHKKYGRNK